MVKQSASLLGRFCLSPSICHLCPVRDAESVLPSLPITIPACFSSSAIEALFAA